MPFDETKFANTILLVHELHKHGSWCGETHIQKTMFVTERFFNHPIGYDFVFYKHGPFSFDLNTDLLQLRASKLLNIHVKHQGYGPSYEITEFGERFLQKYRERLDDTYKAICIMASWLGKSDVRSLEKIASAVYFSKLESREETTKRAACIVEAKPHISLRDAESAIDLVDAKWAEIRSKAKRRTIKAIN
jgi:uncharacterized protein YwgA